MRRTSVNVERNAIATYRQPSIAVKLLLLYQQFLLNMYLKTSSDVVDRHVSLAILVNNLESLDIELDLFLVEVNGNLVSAGTVHHLAHLIVQELKCLL